MERCTTWEIAKDKARESGAILSATCPVMRLCNGNACMMSLEHPTPPKELPKRETDYPRRHPGKLANEKRDLESREEIDRWFALEGKTDTLHLGS